MKTSNTFLHSRSQNPGDIALKTFPGDEPTQPKQGLREVKDPQAEKYVTKHYQT